MHIPEIFNNVIEFTRDAIGFGSLPRQIGERMLEEEVTTLLVDASLHHFDSNPEVSQGVKMVEQDRVTV